MELLLYCTSRYTVPTAYEAYEAETLICMHVTVLCKYLSLKKLIMLTKGL